MSRRLVAVVAPEPRGSHGFPSAALRVAMVEDTYEMVAGLERVEPVLVVHQGSVDADALAGLTWPGTVVLSVPSGTPSLGIMAELTMLGADEAVLIAGDAPDLPPLLVGKLYRGLGSADVALLPASGGGLVALATRCPVPAWVVGAGPGLDVAAAQSTVMAAAPRRGAVSIGPGWHRVRRLDDVRQLDPGLEGWEITRAALRDPANGVPDG